MTTTQLQRELSAVENELRLLRNRLSYLDGLGEHELAAAVRRILAAQENFKDSLTARLLTSHVPH